MSNQIAATTSLIMQTLEACRTFAADPQYSEYAVNIARKATALEANPSAKAAYGVLTDLKAIARMAGTWED